MNITMKPIVINVVKLGPAEKDPSDKGNPWIHRWIYNDGTHKDVVVGRLHPYVSKELVKS